MPTAPKELHRLARLHGLQTAYVDVAGRRRIARRESLLAVLRALGVEIQTSSDVNLAIQQHAQAQRARSVEPVMIAWDDQPAAFDVFVPKGTSGGSLVCTIELEEGGTQRFEFKIDELPSTRREPAPADPHDLKRVQLPRPLPMGYHDVTVEFGDRRREAMIVSAPRRAYAPDGDSRSRKEWAAFLPLYALRSEGGWGSGTYTDLAAFAEWVGEMGGSTVATLPLLPAFLDTPCEPSPYAPLSRLFWNEFYIDVTQIPELRDCAEARERLESAGTRSEIEALRGDEYVDYRRLMKLKRSILEPVSEQFFKRAAGRYNEFVRYTAENPAIERYARFRAVHERQQVPWPQWPRALRDGEIQNGDYDESVRRYHLFAQWTASQQIESVARRASEAGTGLYLDLPLGVHPHGYDVWSCRDTFVTGATAGAPPDAVFTKGQDWGFFPIHPGAIREQKYTHVIDLLRHHLKYAKLLRIDHVMALHRLYWIPEGMQPHEGVYVHYRPEELYAILNLESHRRRTVIVGENLGTVPSYVNTSMSRHRVQRMFVLQYELRSEAEEPLSRPPRGSIASLNTHDMPMFAAYWDGRDINTWLELNLLDEDGTVRERRERALLKRRLAEWLHGLGLLDQPAADARSSLQACLAYLASSRADLLVVNLEDLWLEERPQNIPGTGGERPNWRRTARYRFEQFRELPAVIDALEEIDRLRRRTACSAARKDGKVK